MTRSPAAHRLTTRTTRTHRAHRRTLHRFLTRLGLPLTAWQREALTSWTSSPSTNRTATATNARPPVTTPEPISLHPHTAQHPEQPTLKPPVLLVPRGVINALNRIAAAHEQTAAALTAATQHPPHNDEPRAALAANGGLLNARDSDTCDHQWRTFGAGVGLYGCCVRCAQRCLTCSGGMSRETTGMVCQTCDTDYGVTGPSTPLSSTWCPQCGHPYTDRACGPTHAMVAHEQAAEATRG